MFKFRKRSPKPLNSGLLGLFLLLLLGACAAQDQAGRVIIDQKGVDMRAYQMDLGECTDYAEQVSIARQAGTGAAGGAVVGGVLGTIWKGADIGRSAATGAVLSGTSGGVDGYRERQRVLRKCLTNRGYSVLN